MEAGGLAPMDELEAMSYMKLKKHLISSGIDPALAGKANGKAELLLLVKKSAGEEDPAVAKPSLSRVASNSTSEPNAAAARRRAMVRLTESPVQHAVNWRKERLGSASVLGPLIYTCLYPCLAHIQGKTEPAPLPGDCLTLPWCVHLFIITRADLTLALSCA